MESRHQNVELIDEAIKRVLEERNNRGASDDDDKDDHLLLSRLLSQSCVICTSFQKEVAGCISGLLDPLSMCTVNGAGPTRDELDFEFVGNRTGQPYLIQTNVYKNGTGRELWFDPTKDYHRLLEAGLGATYFQKMLLHSGISL